MVEVGSPALHAMHEYPETDARFTRLSACIGAGRRRNCTAAVLPGTFTIHDSSQRFARRVQLLQEKVRLSSSSDRPETKLALAERFEEG